MRSTRKFTRSEAEVHDYAAGYLQEFVGIKDHGPKCTSSVLISVLFFASAWTTSISDACKRLRRAPSDEAARQALLATLPQPKALETRFNRAFAAQVPKGLRKRPRPLVVDLTENPYYGEPWKHKRELRPGKAKQGTSRFHTFATVYLLSHGQRFTLGVTYVLRDDSLADVLDRLLSQVREIGIRIRYLLLDRGFYNVDVVCYLKRVHCPFLMPVVRRGRRPKDPAKATSVWRFFVWKKSGWSTQTMKYKGRATEVRICVACDKYAGRWGRHGIRRLVFAFWGFQPTSPRWTRETYRKRFGIETSYRQLNQARARTSSRNPVLRLLYVGIALLLRNAWVWFHLVCLAERLRGGALRLHLERLRFGTLLLFLLQYAAELIGPMNLVDFQLPMLE
jgi:hypothetical protein